MQTYPTTSKLLHNLNTSWASYMSFFFTALWLTIIIKSSGNWEYDTSIFTLLPPNQHTQDDTPRSYIHN